MKKALSGVPLRMIVFYFLATRLLIVLLAAFSMQVIRAGAFSHTAHLIDTFDHWDGGWYLNVAQHGYSFSPTTQSTAGFAPLFPLLIHVVTFVFRDVRLAGYFISNACLFGASVVLWKLVARDYTSRDVADRAVLFLLINPVSFFFSTIYTESLFLLLFLLVAYFAAARRWLLAGLCGYLMTLSRLVAVVGTVLLVAEFFLADPERVRGGWARLVARWREEGLRFGASVVMTLLGLGTFCCYLGMKFGDPLAFQKAQAHWGRHFAVPWNFLWHDSVPHEPFYTLWFDEAVVLGFVLFAAGLMLRIRPAHSIVAGAFLILYLSTNLMEAMPRYLSVIFPFYITLGVAATRWPRLEPMLVAGSAMLLMLSTILFVNGYWFT